MRTLLLYIGLLLLVLACVNTEKAIDKATKTEEAAEQTQDALKLRWPEMVEQKYADWFPARETTETKTDTIADTVVKEVVVKGDSIPCP